jgi:hypothetical protein
MPFASRELSVLAYANGFTLWHYRTSDPVPAILAPGGRYFAAADELLRPGDQILLSLAGAAQPAGAALVVTGVIAGLAVEVAPCGWPADIAHQRETAAEGSRRPFAETGLGSWEADAQAPNTTNPITNAYTAPNM